MSQFKHSLEGRCHCGNLGFVLATDKEPTSMEVRICRCDFCLRHRPRYWSDPDGALAILVEDIEQVSRYRFGHATADFHVCSRCGVFAFALFEAGDRAFAVTNMNLWLEPDAQPKERFLEALDENEAQRLERRQSSWTPVVSY